MFNMLLRIPVSKTICQQRTLFLTCFQMTKTPPKQRRSAELRWRRKTNLYHYFKYTRSWHNLVPCDSCGSYHRKWLLCPTCYDQTRYETEKIRKMLREKGEELNEEVVLRYKNDIKNDAFKSSGKRIIDVEERDRPSGWFNEKFWKRM